MPPAPSMDSAATATASSASVHAGERELLLGRRRVDELEVAVSRLRSEKDAAERAAAALRAELESEQGAAETATSEAMLMIGRLQREKSTAMIEAREFRRIVEGRAGRDGELQDQLAAVYELAASYQELLRAHGIDPDEDDYEDEESDHQEERAVERVEADVDVDDNRGGDTEDKGVAIEEPSSSPPPPPPAEEFKYAVDVRCAAVTKAVAEERVVADVAGDLCARVEALEADSAAVRREVAALRAERAQVVLARRLCRDAAAARAVVVAAEKQRFSVFAIFKWWFSAILWGTKRSATTARARVVRNPSSSAGSNFLLGLLPLLERSKGTLQIEGKMAGNGELGLPCRERPWCTPW